MFDEYSSNELYSLYKSFRAVQNNLLCDRCEGYSTIGNKYDCPFVFFCQELYTVKNKMLEELANRGIFDVKA